MLRFSEITRAEAEEALRGLGGKRLLVLVDDVDRMRPELVPTLLMSIRERLFIPGCHFLVAMDPDVVSRALSSVHAGW
jgi:hypothetical protein